MDNREKIILLLNGRGGGPGEGVVIYRAVKAGLFAHPERWHGSGHQVEYTDDDVADIELAVAYRRLVGRLHWTAGAVELLAAWRAVGRAPGVLVKTEGEWRHYPGRAEAAAALLGAGLGIAVVTP